MKKRKKYYNGKVVLFATFTTIVLVSCYFLFSNKTFQYCSNENYLLGIHDSLPVIEINYNNYRNDILEEISLKLNKETCCKTHEFLLKLSANETVNVTLFNYCRSCGIICGNRSFTRILLNRKNQVLVNERPIPNDSLVNYLHKLLKKPITSYDYVENVSIMWDLTTNKQEIEKTFIAIKKAYQLYYEEIALQRFGKHICQLTKKEKEEIKRNQSSIYLGAGNRIFELIPPPPKQ
ncbi:hypothetical protein [Flavobacterium sp. HNIBRBA15423]|uniref:hypothetical protein n=1 Tax=Flavobacterium sp. HNIBRBA15423 TaxID=3458683 RepID=UPI0040440746